MKNYSITNYLGMDKHYVDTGIFFHKIDSHWLKGTKILFKWRNVSTKPDASFIFVIYNKSNELINVQ